jgi:hypothetical protein
MEVIMKQFSKLFALLGLSASVAIVGCAAGTDDAEDTAQDEMAIGHPGQMVDDMVAGQMDLGQVDLGQRDLGQADLGQIGQADLGQIGQADLGQIGQADLGQVDLGQRDLGQVDLGKGTVVGKGAPTKGMVGKGLDVDTGITAKGAQKLSSWGGYGYRSGWRGYDPRFHYGYGFRRHPGFFYGHRRFHGPPPWAPAWGYRRGFHRGFRTWW